MDYARHQVELARPGPDGASQVATWELAAARGNEAARRKLEGPEFPEELAYIWEWARDLHGRSGAGMAGLAPLSYQTIDAWQKLTGTVLTPLEVEALISVDGALLSAGRPRAEGEAATQAEGSAGPPVPAWPAKKVPHA